MNERNHEQTKSTVYGGRYGPEDRGEAVGTAASHTGRDENPDSRRPRGKGARAGLLQGYSSGQQRKDDSGTGNIFGRVGARRRSAAAASSEAAAAQQRRAEGLAARGARPAWAGPARETELRTVAGEGLATEAPAPAHGHRRHSHRAGDERSSSRSRRATLLSSHNCGRP